MYFDGTHEFTCFTTVIGCHNIFKCLFAAKLYFSGSWCFISIWRSGSSERQM